MIELMAGHAAIRRRGLAVILAIFLTGFVTNTVLAADPARGSEGRHTSLHSGSGHANLIIFAQWKTPAKKESWLKKAWKNPKQKPWFFVVGGLVLLTVVVGGYCLVRGVLVGVKECSISWPSGPPSGGEVWR